MKISGVYKITNTVTGEFYIGSSKDISHRWTNHKSPSTWKYYLNNKMYLDMEKYGLKNFDFEIIEETDDLKNREQYFIDLLNPSYNDKRAFGVNIKKRIAYEKSYKKHYYNKLCKYEEEVLTLKRLMSRFQKAGISNAYKEAKKYLIEEVVARI